MSTASAAQAAIQQAIKASGAIVKIDPNDFSHMLSKMDDGLVIEHQGKLFFQDYYKYSTSYKGFIFYCKSNERISIPSRLESISAKQIWVPQ